MWGFVCRIPWPSVVQIVFLSIIQNHCRLFQWQTDWRMTFHSIVTYLSPKYGSSSPSLEFCNSPCFVCKTLICLQIPLRPHRNIFGVISHKRTKSHAEMTKHMHVWPAHYSKVIGSGNETDLKLQSATFGTFKLQQRRQEHVLGLGFQLVVVRNIIDWPANM